MALRLITDSTCDLPADLIQRYNILVVPAIVNMAGQSYRDNVEITRTEFYERLPSLRPLPHTASPAVGEFEAVYQQCGADDQIISIHLATQLSGIYNTARLAAEAFGERVTLVDTGQLSLGLGWQVLAAEAIAAGKSLAEVLAAIESTRRRVKVYALLNTLEYLRRGGRANPITSAIGDLLQIKVILELREGQIIPVIKLRTRRKSIDKLIELIEALGPLERLAILHADALADARALAARLASHSAQTPLVVEVTSVIGTHVGPRALGIAAVKSE